MAQSRAWERQRERKPCCLTHTHTHTHTHKHTQDRSTRNMYVCANIFSPNIRSVKLCPKEHANARTFTPSCMPYCFKGSGVLCSTTPIRYRARLPCAPSIWVLTCSAPPPIRYATQWIQSSTSTTKSCASVRSVAPLDRMRRLSMRERSISPLARTFSKDTSTTSQT